MSINSTRYDRQLQLIEIGSHGQELLSNAKVLIVGAGGLASPIAIYLTAAGVGNISIIDDDIVSLSNLHRQPLYNTSQLGDYKVDMAKQFLSALNPTVNITTLNAQLTTHNAISLIKQHDIVVDACDNFATRCVIDRTCKALKIPYLFGAITDFEGQIALFDYTTDIDYATLFPSVPAQPQQSPVLGTTPAIVGSIMANEVIKYICHFGDILLNQLLVINTKTLEFNKISLY